MTVGETGASTAPPGDVNLSRFDAPFRYVAQRIALVAVASLLLVASGTVVDIVLRNFFGFSLYGLNEISVHLVAIAAATCLPIGLATGADLKIDLIHDRLGPQGREWLDLIGSTLATFFFGLLAWRVWAIATTMAATNQTMLMSSVSVAPFFQVMAVAIGFGAVATSLHMLRAATSLARRDRRAMLFIALFFLVFGHAALAILGLVSPGFYTSLIPPSPLLLVLVIVVVMWILIMLTVPIGVAMGLSGLVGVAAVLGSSSAVSVIGAETTSIVVEDALSVLPLFLLMGAFAGLAGIGADLFRLSYALVGHIRGGLAYASILACAGFGTVTGSSVATQVTIGRIALKEMKDRNYSEALASGTIAAGGTLGQLLPPSTALIVYAIMTEQSVGRLFIGALLPGILATILYMLTITVWLMLYPQDAVPGKRSSLSEIAAAVRGSWSVILLLALVLGGIYFGLFTELEAGSIGAVGAFLIALARGKLKRISFWRTMEESTQSLAMIYSLLFGVTILTFFFGITGLPAAFLTMLDSWGLPPFAIILVLVATYLVLGTFMDGFAMMLITIPIFVPAVVALGYDPIWWGIVTLVCMEAGQISPPFGLNIFVISSLDPKIKITTVFKGCWPFFGSTLVKIGLLLAFPALATWLPSAMH